MPAVRAGGLYQRVRAALPEYLKSPISFLRLSGSRVDEMRKLRWSDVDLEPASIFLPKERSKKQASAHAGIGR